MHQARVVCLSQLYEFYRHCFTAVLHGAEKIDRITPVIYTVLPAYVHRCTFWCRVIGRNMPVVKTVLYFLSVRLIAGVSAVCSGYAFTHLAPTKLAVLYMSGVCVKHPVRFYSMNSLYATRANTRSAKARDHAVPIDPGLLHTLVEAVSTAVDERLDARDHLGGGWAPLYQWRVGFLSPPPLRTY